MRSILEKIVKKKKGNYLVFLPSYQMMEEVKRYFVTETEKSTESIFQERQMSEESRENFLKSFETERSNSLIGFCVMGGIFGEGIDLRADRLIGAVIVGTGLPKVCTEREILKQYYEKQGRDGFFFAYLCPGMNRVQQAAGRVIRTAQDRGVIALLDERFCHESYRNLFPREWENVKICTLKTIDKTVEQFWKETKES